MRILITGAGGFIGKYLLRSFVSNPDTHLTAIYRNTKPDVRGLPKDRVKLIKKDLSEEDLDGIGSVDIIIHAAAHTHLIRDSKASDYMASNILGTLNLARYAAGAKPRLFIYLSTISLYGEITVDELDENTPMNKPEMYGLTKYAGELILEEYEDHFPSVSIRLPGVIGPGYFIPWVGRVAKKILNDEPVTIYNPDSLFNNIVDLIELKTFIEHLISNGSIAFEAVNLAAEEPVKIRDVVDLIVSLTNSKSPVYEEVAQKKSFFIKTKKLKKKFGFQPETTREIISRYILDNMRLSEKARILND